MRLDGDDYFGKNNLAPRLSLNYLTPTDKRWQSKLTFGANRYYGRNLIAYKFAAIRSHDRIIYTKPGGATDWTMTGGGVFAGGAAYTSTDFTKLKTPYDDEFMVALSQNLGFLNATLKYIRRNGKRQLTQELNAANQEVWGNGGSSKADLVSLELKNIEPISTLGVGHLYQLNVDYSDARRTYNVNSSYYNTSTSYVSYNGERMRYADMPTQIYKQPFVIRLTTTHAFKVGALGVNFNNFFRLRSKYDRIVYEGAGSGTCSATNPTACDQYSKMSFKNSFNWDMRLGFELAMPKSNVLYVNFDIYNVLNSKNLTTIGLEDGALLSAGAVPMVSGTGIPSSASVLTYELGRQFWVQIGYKF